MGEFSIFFQSILGRVSCDQPMRACVGVKNQIDFNGRVAQHYEYVKKKLEIVEFENMEEKYGRKVWKIFKKSALNSSAHILYDYVCDIS